MPLLRLRLSDLQTLSGPSYEPHASDAIGADTPTDDELETRIRRRFGFLRGFTGPGRPWGHLEARE